MCAHPHRVFRNKQVESPLTAIDFTPDGAGLVVGSTQGRIYLYDLRNLSAPIKITTAHKTSVTCIRFQNSTSKLKVQLSTLCTKNTLHVSYEVVFVFVKLTYLRITITEMNEYGEQRLKNEDKNNAHTFLFIYLFLKK